MLCVALEVCLYSAVTLQGWDSLLKLLTVRTSVKNTFLEAFEAESSPTSPSQDAAKQRSRSCGALPDDVFARQTGECTGPVEMPGQATRAEISGRTDARGGAFKAGQMEAPSYKVIVKNTFVEVQEDTSPIVLRRSQSDGDLEVQHVADLDVGTEGRCGQPHQVRSSEAMVPKYQPTEAPQQPPQMLTGSMAAPLLNQAIYPDHRQGAASMPLNPTIASFAAALGASFAMGLALPPQLWAVQSASMVQSTSQAHSQAAETAPMVTPVKSRRRRGRRSGKATPKEGGSSSSTTPEKLEKPVCTKTAKGKQASKVPQGAAEAPLPAGWVKELQKESEGVPSLRQRLEAFRAQQAQQTNPVQQAAAVLASCDSSSSSEEDLSGECDRVHAELHARIKHHRKYNVSLGAAVTRRQAGS
ncbi:unnamed protein product [Symbiodinium natans]|uniref:Uncharacterized protein n=1 Tax=Symbiodinium natans TaxID=878477 RepID=A0A812RGV1_9DINO|nr:unnamed protein product [Symbiodinium natans]